MSCCQLVIRSGFTQSSDEVFFTASNQIVKDLRSIPGIIEYQETLQASKLAAAATKCLYRRDKTAKA